jgi:hypothetical protein
MRQGARTERGHRGTLYRPFHIAEGLSGHEDCFAVCQSEKKMKTITKYGHMNLVATETCSWRCGSMSAGKNPLSEETKRLFLSRSFSSPTSCSASWSSSFSASSCPFFCPCSPSSSSFPHRSTLYRHLGANPSWAARSSARNFPVVWRIRYLPALSRARFPLI